MIKEKPVSVVVSCDELCKWLLDARTVVVFFKEQIFLIIIL